MWIFPPVRAWFKEADMSVTNPVAIITAAGHGMGAACAHALAERGWRLALLSPSGAAVTLAAELGGIGVTGSVTEPSDLQRLVDQTLDTYGRIDGVVNNTGHPATGNLLAIEDGAWYAALDLVLMNTVRMARLVTPVMQTQGGGAFVNISTYAAFEPDAAFPLSCVFRAGLGAFTKLYADAHAAFGIRMNNVLPGYIDSYPENPDLVARIPAGRFGKVGEIGATTAFLLSADAGYITGQNLRVDGGLSRGV
jgi:NAD(P)-dependent dehydrogenase (short-subunit alcohol dehydrogenase family)